MRTLTTISSRGISVFINGGKSHKTPSQKVAEIERLKAAAGSGICQCGLKEHGGGCPVAGNWRFKYAAEHSS